MNNVPCCPIDALNNHFTLNYKLPELLTEAKNCSLFLFLLGPGISDEMTFLTEESQL